jgi:recombinational DNA repair ATPase RecF
MPVPAEMPMKMGLLRGDLGHGRRLVLRGVLKGIRLQRFKNFEDAYLPLGSFTVLIGTNASGKSNLRDALRFPRYISWLQSGGYDR